MMRSLVLSLLLVALAVAMPADVVVPSHDDILGGALCLPCIELIKTGETNTITDFDTWFTKETTALCSPLGAMKKLCIQYFHQYEKDFDTFITTKADPKKSCQSIDFCS